MPQPKLAWDFDGTTTDYVSGLVPTTVTGTPTYTTGKYNQSVVFTNTAGSTATNALTYTLSPITSLTSGFTIAYWFKFNSVPPSGRSGIWRIPATGAGNGGAYMLYYASGQTNFGYTQTDQAIMYAEFDAYFGTLTVGTWYHAVYTISGTTQTAYLNGVLKATNSSLTATYTLTNPTMSLGSHINFIDAFDGELDDLRIFDRALTSAQVQAIYNQGGMPGRGVTSKAVPTFTISDQSQNPLTLSTYGTTVTYSSSPFGRTEGSFRSTTLSFPSTVTKTNFDFYGSKCFFEFWFKTSAVYSGTPRIISRGNYPSEAFTIQHISSNRLQFSYVDGLNVERYPFVFTYTPGIWNHLSISFNVSNSTLYGSLNGVVSTYVIASLPVYNSSSTFYLYRLSGGTTDLIMSNFRLVSGAATLPYISNFTVPTTPLSIYPTGTTALLLRAVSPLTIFPDGAIQSATGGDTVQDIGGYRIHTFTTVGTSTFTPATSGAVEVLVVAGGGSGGTRHAGGGGAGGLIYNSSFSVSGAVTVIVGDGGAGRGSGLTAGPGNPGDNSVFSSLIAIGGGYGNQGAGGGSGGSGGGVWSNYTVGAGTAGQGNNGAFGSLAPYNDESSYGGGGGGGAGAPGTASTSGTLVTAGSGGIGIQYSISGTPTYYAGGGGGSTTCQSPYYATGGSGGLGGGGAGGGFLNGSTNFLTDGVAGTNGTGGGGGAGGFTNAFGNYASGKGGSGIVIVRYPLPIRLSGTPLFTQLSPSATSSAVGAFSLRAVNGTTAKAVQVRRSTDSATQDFYADRLGNLLTAPVVGQPLAIWLGGATGYVATWYDQSGAGNHASQATAANQPIIQKATKGPGYSCLFNGTTTQLVSTLSGSLDSTNYTICSASRRQAAGEMYYIGTNGPSSSRQQLSAGYYTDTTTVLNEQSYALISVTISGYSAGSEPMGYDFYNFSQTNGMYIYNWRSGTSYASGNSGLTLPMTSSGNILLGYAPWNGANKYFSGEIFELTIFKTSLFDLSGSTPGTYTTPPSIIQSIYQNQLGYTGV